MKRISLKFIVGFLAFVIGVLATAFWFYNPFSTNRLKEKDIIQNKESIDEQYAVYSAVINEMFGGIGDSISILNKTSQKSFYDEYLENVPPEQHVLKIKQIYVSWVDNDGVFVDKNTLLDFAAKKNNSIELYPKFDTQYRYNLIDEKEITENKNHSEKQIFRFSQVGFNKNKTRAFVEISRSAKVL